MLDLASGLPYFWIKNGLPFEHDALKEDVHCEVLVVGGGITGALCAHACAKAGLETTVVDSRAIGTGSTAASTALLQYELDVPLHVLAENIGERVAVRTYRSGIEAVGKIVALARSLGLESARSRSSLQYASRRAHEAGLKKEFAIRGANGIPAELLSRSETKQRFGSIDAMALFNECAGEVDPYALTHHLLQSVVDLGGSIYDRTEVVHFERKAQGFELRTRSGHTITAAHLIMATGYESQRYLSKPVMDLHSTYAVASERIGQETIWHDDCLIWETATPYLYMRTTPDRRVVVGGFDEPFRDPQRRDKLLTRKTKKLTAAFRDRFPLVPFEPEYAWCGTFGSTRDGLPYIDQDPDCGAWFVLGMGGNGITFSMIGAEIVRDAILGTPNANAALFRFKR